MSCSCKVKKSEIIIDPATKVQRIVQLDKNAANKRQFQTQQKSSKEFSLQDIDISSITEPDQTCFNCIRKHLGLAYMFLKKGGNLRKVAAAGQLMCAANHINKEFPNLSFKLIDYALFSIRQLDSSISAAALLPLIDFLQKDPSKDIQPYIPKKIYQVQSQLLTLAMLYSLLFVQITYEQINKTWATAHLSYMAYTNFRDSQDIKVYQQYRTLWKLIQSMQLYDQNYNKARQLLQQLCSIKQRQIHLQRSVEGPKRDQIVLQQKQFISQIQNYAKEHPQEKIL